MEISYIKMHSIISSTFPIAPISPNPEISLKSLSGHVLHRADSRIPQVTQTHVSTRRPQNHYVTREPCIFNFD